MGAFFEHFGRCAGYQKTLKNLWFFKVFGGFGVVGWDGWGILAADLDDVGSMMAFFG